MNKKEPKPEVLAAAPEPPAYLNEAAKEEWHRVLTILLRMRIVTDADLGLVAIYCDNFGKWREANDFIGKRGMFFPILTDDGKKIRYLQQYPHVNIAERCAVLMVQIGDRLGLNPAARSRIAVPEAGSSVAQTVAKRLLGG